MKIKLSLLMFFLFMLLGAVTSSFGQTGNLYEDEFEKAAKFAVKDEGQKQKATVTLVSIKKGDMQTSEGTLTVELCLEVRSKKPRKKAVKQFVKTLIYRDMEGKYWVKSWVVKKTPDCQ